ncbi:MAG: hypothetical protein QF724_04170 [Planctomycetota bacterium]|jgi:hypothetical protein|nr:hypothetical protein [Planctomycetota bacterium]MDP6519290.1 hypothetical protein [Planctomycetota bacterium]MDP6838110.1 hypothetical protein [Planctomycetota bacterium]
MNSKPLLTPFCAYLRSKKWFTLEAPARDEEELLDASGHCWCRCTMLSVGPDGEIVDPEDCRAGRDCYQSLGGAESTDAPPEAPEPPR